MCGIFGYSGREKLEKSFFQLMKHRGPDAAKKKKISNWNLGHLRLAIIDKSSSANQPYEKNGAVLTFNGEIYNYIELRKKYFPDLKLNTNSDTEILIMLLNKFGLKILNELNGMFAFAYLNKKKELFLVRDRFGVKPIYYTKIKKNFYFSSEIKPLLFLKSKFKLNQSMLKSYFADTATDFNEQSGYDEIFQIKRGHYKILKNNEKTVKQIKWYYDLSKTRFHKNIEKATEFCENILLDSIKIRCRSDVPIAITLSGGIDSTVIYTLIKEKLKLNIQPFVFRHSNKETDETTLALNLANKYGDKPIIVNEPIDPLKVLKDALWHLELPPFSLSVLAYSTTYKEIAKRGYKVVLEGHGSDEQLGGYTHMVNISAKEALEKKNFNDYFVRKKVLLETQHPGLDERIKGFRIITTIIRDIIDVFSNKKANFNKTLHESFDYKIIPIVLRTFDRLSMSHSIESRMPFMDYRFVEFVRNLPTNFKISKIGSKSILREILKKYNNDEIYLNKIKMGWSSDLTTIFNNNNLKKYLYKLINDLDSKKYTKFSKYDFKSPSKFNYTEFEKAVFTSYYDNYKI